MKGDEERASILFPFFLLFFIADTFDAIFRRRQEKQKKKIAEENCNRLSIEFVFVFQIEIVSNFRRQNKNLLVKLESHTQKQAHIYTSSLYNKIRSEPKVAKGSIIYPADAQSMYMLAKGKQ